jgi:TonB-dependent starch-binding outer membrane protein SusC
MKKKRISTLFENKDLIKLLIAMKFCFMLLLLTTAQVFSNVYSQAVKLNFNLKNSTVEDALRIIEGQSNYKFLYHEALIENDKITALQVKNENIDEVMKDLLAGTGNTYTILENNLVVITPKNTSLRQENKVTGIVTDGTTGEALPGVNIMIEGTTQGVTTDLDGKYSVSIPQNGAVLVFSYIGYVAQKLNVSAPGVLDVKMQPDLQTLDEVVVVGYGTQKKVNMTGSVSTVRFDESLDNRPITNASQALGGEVTGVWVSQNSGKPGNDGAQLRIRGWGTLNNAEPLVIIDGVEGTFSQLNPNDIESISVLKDAASSAIYGSKAANGVILITTKAGKLNEKMEITLSSYAGLQTLGMHYDLINNSAEMMELYNQALINDGSSAYYPQTLIDAFKNGSDKYKYPNTNWFNELFKPALMQEHNLSIQGGSSQTSSFLSFNYLDQDGMVPHTSSKRYGMRANLESDLNKWLKVGGRMNFTRKNSVEPYADVVYGSLGRVFEMLGGAPPFIAPFTRDGKFGSVQAIADNGTLLYDNRNPLIDAANGKTLTEENYLGLNAFAEIKFMEGLTLKTTFASTDNWNLTDLYNQSVYGYTDSGVQTITKNFNREGLEIGRRNVTSVDNNLFTTLNYNKTIGGIHNLSAILGAQIESFVVKNQYSRRTSPPKEGLTQVDAGTSGIVGEGNMSGYRMLSYFGRLNYTLKDKYLFEANVRADASSRFKQGSRWGVFPGFSAGWRLVDEPFIKDLNIFSNLKLRASWGQLGNQSIAGYWPYLTVITQNNAQSYSSAGAFLPGAGVTSLVDENITWETTTTLDFGLDVGLLNNKLTMEADYFNKKTSDIIVQLPIPKLMGEITSPYENVGEMVNNGFEFVANYSNQVTDRDRFGFTVGGNMTYIVNEVTRFQGGKSPDQLYLIREGYSYRTLYGYKAVGIFQSDQEGADYMFANSFKPKAGSLKFEDVNQDGKLGFEDKQALGNTIPKLTYGISSNLRYKGFDLNILFQGIAGVNVYTQNNFTNINWENQVTSTRWRDSWSPENTGSANPMLRINNTWDNQESSYWVHKLNYIKLKNIQLGYLVPTDVVSKIGLKKAYVYLNAQNVFTIVNKDYEGYDPERNTFDSGYSMYPIPRIVSLGVNLNF